MQLALSGQLVHYGSRFAVHGVQHIAIAVGGRVGYRDAALGQVLHQEQIKGQLLVRQSLEQGQHELTLMG